MSRAITSRALGWLPRPRDKRDDAYALSDSPLHAERGAGILGEDVQDRSTLPLEVDHLAKTGTPYNQGELGSCVGQGVGKMLEHDYRKRGIEPLILPSTLAIYNLARSSHKLLEWDLGTNARAALEAVRKIGIVPESFFPYSDQKSMPPGVPAPYQRLPPTRGIMVAADTAEALLYRFVQPTYLADRVTWTMRLLAQGYIVGFGTKVTTDFVHDDLLGLVERPDPSQTLAGGHFMVIVGYRVWADGRVHFRTLNSWGRTWNGDGTFWMSESYLTWDKTKDLVYVEHAPVGKLAA